ncbi:hypothetical protein HN51_015218, partial [Arachis hypogaea]
KKLFSLSLSFLTILSFCLFFSPDFLGIQTHSLSFASSSPLRSEATLSFSLYIRSHFLSLTETDSFFRRLLQLLQQS